MTQATRHDEPAETGPSHQGATDASLPREYIPAGDGPLKGQPQKWIGELSHTLFECEWQNGYPVLTAHLQAEIPLQIKDLMRDEETLKTYAELFDLALKVAVDDEIRMVDIADNVLGLSHISTFLRQSYQSLTQMLEQTRQTAEPGPENARKIRRTEASLEVIRRIADRIDARIGALPQLLVAAIKSGDPSTHWH